MKFFNNTKVNFKLIFENYGFYICAIFTVLLCLCGSAYYDVMKEEGYSVIAVLTQFDKEELLSDTIFSSFKMIQSGSVNGAWFSMFLPVIAAFAFVPIICDESGSRFLRNEIFHTSKMSFYASKFITACLAGGLAVMLGFAVYAGFAYIAFPSISQYSPELQEVFKMELEYLYAGIPHGSLSLLTGLKFVEMFLYGAICAAPAVFLTSLMKNKYLVICIPFFLKFALDKLCEKLMSSAWDDIEHPNLLLGRLAKIFSPASFSNLFQSGDRNYILIYNGVLLVLLFAGYLVIQNRRLDCGE